MGSRGDIQGRFGQLRRIEIENGVDGSSWNGGLPSLRWYLLPLAMVALVLPAILILFQFTAPPLTVTEDTETGYITVENANVKGVWHYAAIAADNYNQAGGSLYELYNKQLDPGMSQNLVAYYKIPGWGNGSSTPVWFGIGGLGSTSTYASDNQPSATGSNDFTDFIAENNLSGILESHNTDVDQSGNAFLDFTYRVRNQATGKEWYRITKHWTVKQDGAVQLQITWNTLADGWFSEPAVRFNWDRNKLWDRWHKYGYNWGSTPSNKYLLGTDNLASYLPSSLSSGQVVYLSWDVLNQFFAEFISLEGSPDGSLVTVSGSLGFGAGALQDHTLEQSVGELMEGSNLIGAYAMAWMEWWGGNPPNGTRYQFLSANTSWNDNFTIAFSDVVNEPPDIHIVGVEPGNDGARFSWHTDVIADSEVVVTDIAGGVVADVKNSSLVQDHSVPVAGLQAGTAYAYHVKSTDVAGGLAANKSYDFTTLSGAPFTLTPKVTKLYWKTAQDYSKRRLSVDFTVTNLGPALARSVAVTLVTNNRRASLLTGLPIALGDIAPGAGTGYTLTFQLRKTSDKNTFTVGISGVATAPSGTVLKFP